MVKKRGARRGQQQGRGAERCGRLFECVADKAPPQKEASGPSGGAKVDVPLMAAEATQRHVTVREAR